MNRRQELIDRLSSKPGLRGRVDAHCVSCVYEEGQGGSWRQQVQACTVTECPLYPVRARRAPA